MDFFVYYYYMLFLGGECLSSEDPGSGKTFLSRDFPFYFQEFQKIFCNFLAGKFISIALKFSFEFLKISAKINFPKIFPKVTSLDKPASLSHIIIFVLFCLALWKYIIFFEVNIYIMKHISSKFFQLFKNKKKIKRRKIKMEMKCFSKKKQQFFIFPWALGIIKVLVFFVFMDQEDEHCNIRFWKNSVEVGEYHLICMWKIAQEIKKMKNEKTKNLLLTLLSVENSLEIESGGFALNNFFVTFLLQCFMGFSFPRFSGFSYRIYFFKFLSLSF